MPNNESDNNITSPLDDLLALQAEHEQEIESRESTRAADAADYRYYQLDQMLAELDVDETTMREARRLLDVGEVRRMSCKYGFYEDGTQGMICELGYIVASAHVSIAISREHVVSARCNAWSCFSLPINPKSVLHRDVCEHVVAAFLDLIENPPTDLGDSTSLEANHALSSYLKQGLTPLDEDDFGDEDGEDAGISGKTGSNVNGQAETGKAAGASSPRRRRRAPVEPLHLVPTLVIYEGDDLLYLTFRFGRERLYKIRNLWEFIAKARMGQEIAFGSHANFRVQPAAMDPRSREWYQLLYGAIGLGGELDLLDTLAWSEGRVRELASTQPGSGGKSLLPLYGADLDYFLETLGSDPIDMQELGEHSKRAGVVRRMEHTERFRLRLEPLVEKNSFDGIVLSGELPRVYRGRKHSCCLRGDKLLVTSSEQTQVLEPLMKQAEHGRIHLTFGRNHLANFYKKIYPVLLRYTDLEEIQPELIASYLPVPCTFAYYFDRVDEDVVCRMNAVYGNRSYDITGGVAGRGEVVHEGRSAVSEQDAWDALAEYLPNYDEEDGVLWTNDEERIFALLDHGIQELMEDGEVQVTQRFRDMSVRRRVPVRVGVSIKSGLLDLSVQSSELSEEELQEVLDSYYQKKKYFRLKDGSFLSFTAEGEDENSIAHLAQMLEDLQVPLKDFVKGKMHLPAYRALYLEKMLSDGGDVEMERDSSFGQLIEEFDRNTGKRYEIPAPMKGVLRSYQKEGYRWLRMLDACRFGGILADDMGLGKTLQVITVLQAVVDEELFESAPGTTGVAPSLIVCPASLVYNWCAEIERFAPGLRVCALAGQKEARADEIAQACHGGADVIVTSYDLLKRDIAEYEGVEFRFEILDEAQYIKNPTTAAAKSVKLIKARTRYALTGTPIENRLSELWSIFDYLMPGLLYSYHTFNQNFETPIVKYGEEECQERLRRMVGPFILRRLKEDVLTDLPDKLEEVSVSGMEHEQRTLYEAEVLKLRQMLAGASEEEYRKDKIRILAELMRIRQLCCDPALCVEGYKGGSAKLETCMAMVNRVMEGGHKALIFSQFTSMLAILEERLNAEDIPYYKITGSTPKEKRIELVNRFNEDQTPIFLISLKAGGTGLNLTGADVVIHYDPWWNVAAQNQATDRAHRIGQKRVVTVYKLIVKDTIEEKIVQLQNAKKQLADDILTGEEVGSSRISRDDLMGLLG